MSFSLNCIRCRSALKMNDYAIDKTCQNKHVFFFECPDCGEFSATAMANIAQQRWHEFIPADKLDGIILKFNVAMKKTA